MNQWTSSALLLQYNSWDVSGVGWASELRTNYLSQPGFGIGLVSETPRFRFKGSWVVFGGVH